MKFDKFMEHCFKIMCICVACVVFLGVVFSCTGATLTARAVSLSASEKAGIQDYFNAYSNGMLNLNIDFSTDEDGNRSRKIEIYALQQRALQDQFQIYDDMNLDFSTTQSMGGSGVAGLYKYDGVTKVVNVDYFDYVHSTTDYTFITAPDFTFSSKLHPDNAISQFRCLFYDENSSQYRCRWHYAKDNSAPSDLEYYCLVSGSGITHNSKTIGKSSITSNLTFSFSKTSIPSFGSSGFNLSLYSEFTIGGFASNYTLPDADIQTSSPWDYYNDSLLPYIRQNYDIDNIDQYLVFPDGYNPGPTYITNNNTSVVVGPVIIGDPSIINLGGVDFDVFAPIKGQLSIDGIDFNFPQDQNDNRVFIDGQPYELPLPEITIGDHTISVDDRDTIHFDGFEFHFNADGTITINNTDYTLPVGTPSVLPSDVFNYEMYYEIPTMENINIVDSDISPVDISAFGDGINFIWGLIARFYSDTGLFGAMVTCLGLGAIGFGIAKLGGH